MATELLTKNGPAAMQTAPAPTIETELRAWARTHVERVRRLKLHLAAFVVGMAVLTPTWVLIEWQDNGGFERWSANSNPGDWEPWILYVAGVWSLVLALTALRIYFDRPTTDAEIDREIERVTRR